MTKNEFKALKIGDKIYLPNRDRKSWVSTEVLNIDRLFNKVQVLLKSKFLSYRYFPIKVSGNITAFVGTCKKIV